MTRALLILETSDIRLKAKRWVDQAPIGTRVEFKAPKRSIEQNALMWALLTEVAEQVAHHGIKLGADDWKLIFLDALKREVRMVPNLDGNGFVNLGRSTSDLSKDEMTDMIELIMAFGAKHELVFKTKATGESSQALPDTDDEGSASIPESSDEEVAGVMSPPAPATSDNPERDMLIKYARDVLPRAADPNVQIAALNAIEKRWMQQIGNLTEDGQEKAEVITKSMRAIVNGKTSLESAATYFADVLDTTQAVIMGKEEA